jgi:transcriptional regulator with XRE-family HTH domain
MKDEHLIAFGCRVRRLRTALGLTVEDLARRSGLEVRQIVSIEGGEFALTKLVVFALIRGLGCAPHVLLRTPEIQRRIGLHYAAEQAGRLFDAAPPEVQLSVRLILRALAKRRARPAPDSSKPVT